jgi:hypothetical protein
VAAGTAVVTATEGPVPAVAAVPDTDGPVPAVVAVPATTIVYEILLYEWTDKLMSGWRYGNAEWTSVISIINYITYSLHFYNNIYHI